MKKIVAIALTLALLCGAVTVFADTLTVPSKTTEDLTTFEVTVENPVDGKAVILVPIANQEEAEAELAKIQAAKSVVDYFGEEAGKVITDTLGTEISLDEFMAVIEQGYEEGMGAATVTAKVATPYEKDEKAVALIGMAKDGELAWNAYEAVGLADGRLQFVVDADTMLKLMNGTALYGICSK